MTDARPLNVIRIISFLTVGGVQSMLLSTLPHYDRARFRIRVVCTTRSGPVGEALVQQGIPVDVVRLPSRLGPIGLWRLSRYLKAQHADIVHTHMYASNISGVLAARLAGVPVIISHIHSDHEWRSRGRALMDGWCDRYRSGYLAVAASVRDAFLAKTGLPPSDRIRVVHNVPRPMKPEPADSSAAAAESVRLRAELGIPAAAPVVGSVTRLVPVKGLDGLLRAMKRVVDRIPEARLVLVGRGKEREALRALAQSLGLSDRVILAGERLDVEAFYRLFHCFVLSSRSEGCPNVILEAMRCGLPIVATRVGGVPELIERGRNGLLVPYGDEAALADAIARFLERPELARSLGSSAREVAADYTVPSYVAKVQDYYDELYARSRRQRALGKRFPLLSYY